MENKFKSKLQINLQVKVKHGSIDIYNSTNELNILSFLKSCCINVVL